MTRWVTWRMVRRMATALALAGVGLWTACAVGPKYQRPPVQAPEAWKTQTPSGPWQPSAPKDSIPKGAWWTIFHDDLLNTYEQQLLQANFSLQAAGDRLEQARAAARVVSAGLFPQVAVDPGLARERYSGNRPLLTTPTSALTQYSFSIPLTMSYEVDLFGRVRRNLESANASLQATAADRQNVQLILTAELAADYFTLRELDAETAVVQESAGYQQKGLDLVNRRHSGGIASGLDVAQQESVLDATVAQISLLQQQRQQFEHAIAVLTGNPASTFSVPVAPLGAIPPPVPLGVPSDVLERRPDIATAERLVAAQNAQVGVATAAFYPHITLAGAVGALSTTIGNLATTPSLVWSLGADALQPIVNGGANSARLAEAKASYNESVANYRQSVLSAFQQVEDALSGLTTLSQAAAEQNAAVKASQRALTIANYRYEGGLTTYLDVITAQTTLLSNQRLATQLLGQQMVTSVALVKALGGGWDAADIRQEQVHPHAGQALKQ